MIVFHFLKHLFNAICNLHWVLFIFVCSFLHSMKIKTPFECKQTPQFNFNRNENAIEMRAISLQKPFGGRSFQSSTDPRRNANSDTLGCWSQRVYANRPLRGLTEQLMDLPDSGSFHLHYNLISEFLMYLYECMFFNSSFQMPLKSVVDKHIKFIYYFWWCTVPRLRWWWSRYVVLCMSNVFIPWEYWTPNFLPHSKHLLVAINYDNVFL